MGDSRTRAEDKLAELAEAEENQRQLHAHSEAPSLSRVLQCRGKSQAPCATEDTTFYPPHGHKPQPPAAEPEPEPEPDDGPPVEVTHRCGPLVVDNDGEVSVDFGPLWTSAEAKRVFDALCVLIREEVIK